MGSSNYISNVAIVGAAGNLGTFITAALLQTGKHTVTAITRIDSQSTFPEGVSVRKVDYSIPETLVDALRGQDALIITLSGRSAIAGIEEKLVRAAAEAGVSWILPNEWSPDTANGALVKDLPFLENKVKTRKLISSICKSSYTAIVTGYWYEWSLSNPEAYGFNISDRTVTLFDEGETNISTSTWPHIGSFVANLLSLPLTSDTASLNTLRNTVIYTSAFSLTQNLMFSSLQRVTQTRASDWTITKQPLTDRFTQGKEEIDRGEMKGWAKMGYSRIFFGDGVGDFEEKVIRLPGDEAWGAEEKLDEATVIAVKRQMDARAAGGRS